jgi:hypothetical protein
MSQPQLHRTVSDNINGNTVRNFPTHGQLSAAQGSPTNCLSTLTLPFKLFDSSALYSDGPEVELNWPFPYPILPHLKSLMNFKAPEWKS